MAPCPGFSTLDFANSLSSWENSPPQGTESSFETDGIQMAKREKQNLNIKKPENGSPRRAFGWERTGSSSRLMFFFFLKRKTNWNPRGHSPKKHWFLSFNHNSPSLPRDNKCAENSFGCAGAETIYPRHRLRPRGMILKTSSLRGTVETFLQYWHRRYGSFLTEPPSSIRPNCVSSIPFLRAVDFVFWRSR